MVFRPVHISSNQGGGEGVVYLGEGGGKESIHENQSIFCINIIMISSQGYIRVVNSKSCVMTAQCTNLMLGDCMVNQQLCKGPHRSFFVCLVVIRVSTLTKYVSVSVSKKSDMHTYQILICVHTAHSRILCVCTHINLYNKRKY